MIFLQGVFVVKVFQYLVQLFQRAKRALVHSPVTLEFPYVASAFPLNSKIKLKNNFSECTVCRDCEGTCPVQAIKIEAEQFSPQIKKPKTAKGLEIENALYSFKVDYSKCVFCGLCVNECKPQSLGYERNIVEPKTQTRLLEHEMYSNKKV